MSNRYNNLLQDRYVSTYVPLPLEQISGLAQDYTNRYNTGKNLPQQFDLLTQKINAAPIDYDNKDRIIKDYKSKIDDLVNNAKADDYAKPEYQDKIKNLTMQFAKDPRLQSIINNRQLFDKQFEPYLNSKESKEDLILSNITDKNHPTGYKQLKPGEVLQPLDYIKYERSIDGVKTIMDNIAVKGTSLSSIEQWSKDGNYFIDTDGHRKEVSKEDVYNVAKANIGNYAENTQGKFRFKTLLHQTGLDPHMNYTDFMYSDKVPDNIKEGINNELTRDLYNYGTKQIFKDDDIKYNLKDNVLKQHAGKKAIDNPINLPQTSPDIENAENLTKEIPKDIQHIFGYEKQPDGSYKAKYNYDKLGESKRNTTVSGGVNSPFLVTLGKKEGDVSKEASKAWDYLHNAAKAIGYDTKNLSLNNKQQVEGILNQYMEYSKSVSPQEILQGPQQDLITHNIINDRGNYTLKDSEGNVIPNDKMPILDENNFKAINRTYSKGQQIIKAQRIDEDGKVEKYTVIPHSTQSNLNFNTVGAVKERVSEFFKNGKFEGNLNEESKAETGLFEKISANTTGGSVKKYNDPGYKGLKPISFKKVPGTNNEYIVTLMDEFNRTMVKNDLVKLYSDQNDKDEQGNPKIKIYEKNEVPGGLDGLEQYISDNWYSKTPEGRHEALQLANSSTKFKKQTSQ
jgi:hypothetical protein